MAQLNVTRLNLSHFGGLLDLELKAADYVLAAVQLLAELVHFGIELHPIFLPFLTEAFLFIESSFFLLLKHVFGIVEKSLGD